mmetsp:Transcript_98742/g.156118  ORF Transcript_98742/g.156118 Transcript_98742/m.156118 type:complete len:528 (-) Transcript_98742:130-1713(-)
MTNPPLLNSIVPLESDADGDWRRSRKSESESEVVETVEVAENEFDSPPRPPVPTLAWSVPDKTEAAEVSDAAQDEYRRNPWHMEGTRSDVVFPRGVFDFSDTEDIKRHVRSSILKPHPYNVFDLYNTTGIWQLVAKHALFENITLAVIAANAVWIAIDTDWNKQENLSDADAIFQVAENGFCMYFSLEWIVRFMAFRRKRDGLKDSWFVFDSLLVILMVMETWIFPIIGLIIGTAKSPLGGKSDLLRLFRLLRLSRLLRMLRSLPELMILIKGMITAMKSVLYVLCLLVLIIYVFAIMFTQLAEGTEYGTVFFDTVPLSMYSLLIYGTFVDDLAYFCDTIRLESYPVLILVLVFVCLACLTVLNMLVGVLCEVVSAVAKTEKEMITTATVSEKMQGIVSSLDINSNGKISFVEFRKILDIPEALRALEEVGVDPAGIVDFAELMFFEDGDHEKQKDLPFEEFMELVLDLRESNVATVKDIKYLCRQINPKITAIWKDIEGLRNRAERMEDTLAAILSEVKKISSKLS